MVYFDINDCDVCHARQVDTNVKLTIDGYSTVCRNCYSLIKGIIKEYNKTGEDLKKIMNKHIKTKTWENKNIKKRSNKDVYFFNTGTILGILKTYVNNKNLLKSVLEEEPKWNEGVKKSLPYDYK